MNIGRSVNFFTVYVTPVISSVLAVYCFIEMIDSYQMMNTATAHLNAIDIDTTNTSVGELVSAGAGTAISIGAGFGFIMFRAFLVVQIIALLWWLKLWYLGKFFTLPKSISERKSLTFEAKLYTILSCALYAPMLLLLFS